jgi:hypothetical protein
MRKANLRTLVSRYWGSFVGCLALVVLNIVIDSKNPLDEELSQASTNPKSKTAKVAPAPRNEENKKGINAIESIFIVDQQ